MAFPGGRVGKNLPANTGDLRDLGLIPGLERPPGVGNGTPVILPGKSHEQRSLEVYSPCDCKKLDFNK